MPQTGPAPDIPVPDQSFQGRAEVEVSFPNGFPAVGAALSRPSIDTRTFPAHREEMYIPPTDDPLSALDRNWPLTIILVIQAALSLRLIWSNTAFPDEALYLVAGHLEWGRWLDGSNISSIALPTYFSGSPVVYPPLAALADTLGGLAAARLLSLAFMLAATCLLHGTARRLFDRRTALFASVLFAGVGSTQFLGAFATYDAMALFLLTVSTWIAVRAARCRKASAVAMLLVLAGLTLALADAAKYAAALFDPVVIGTAVLASWRFQGRNGAVRAALVLPATLAMLVAIALRAGGPAYWHGIQFTTLSRGTGDYPIFGILYVSAGWLGAVLFFGVIGLATAIVSRPALPEKLLAGLLTVALVLAPAEQARIHVFTSLFKHVGYGAWFGCIIAGYALASFSNAVPARKRRKAACVAVVAALCGMISGALLASDHFSGWPNVTRYEVALAPWLADSHGPILMDTASVQEYYLRLYNDLAAITNSTYFAYTDPATGKRITQPAAAYADAIKHRYFSLITLEYGNAPDVFDPGIVRDIGRYGGYRLVSSIPYRLQSNAGRFLTFVREGGAG
jgi:4-amino-4-deoxy-L-arabinose transferase-like glycosyltransferase